MEPPAPDFDAVQPVIPELEPNPSAAKTIGTLNIVFGVLLLLCGVCAGLNLVMQSAMAPMVDMQQQQLQAAMAAQRQQELRKLEEREKASEDQKEKAELQAQRKAREAQPLPKMPDMTKFVRDMQFQGYLVTDLITGFILNILMVVSGIGLVGLKDWGRVTALWVAALKIIRLVGVYSFFALALAPVMVKQFAAMIQEMSEEMAKAAPPGQKPPGPDAAQLGQMATVMGGMLTGLAIGMILLGAIYPVIVLIVLTRPRVKAACCPRLGRGP